MRDRNNPSLDYIQGGYPSFGVVVNPGHRHNRLVNSPLQCDEEKQAHPYPDWKHSIVSTDERKVRFQTKYQTQRLD